MRYAVAVEGRAGIVGAPRGADEAALLEGHLDDVMQELLKLEVGDPALTDSDLSARLAVGHVEISVVVEADTIDRANEVGMGTIRCAIHAAGGHTPGWENVEPATWELEVETATQRRLDLIDV